MPRRVPLIAELPGPTRLAIYYLAAAVLVCAVFYLGVAFENIALVVAAVFGASFWLFSLVLVVIAMILAARKKDRETRGKKP